METCKSLRKQETIVSSVAKKLPPFQGTFVDSGFVAREFLVGRPTYREFPHSYNMVKMFGGNLKEMVISFLTQIQTESHPQGPNLLHFSQAQLTDVEKATLSNMGYNY